MIDARLVALIAVSLVVIVTPGQDTALTIRNTLRGGRASGVFTALGVVSGQLTWTLAAGVGLTALILASQPAFLVLKLAGAAYLVYLGAQSLRSAILGERHDTQAHQASSASRRDGLAAYRQGLLSNLANPKVAVFFASLLPQFLPAGGSFQQLLPLGVMVACMTLVWLCAYAVVIARAGDLLRRGPVRRALDGVTGGVLLVLGARLATAER